MKCYHDSTITALLAAQAKTRTSFINLIASESYAPCAVRELLASIVTDKYSEGYPQHRYYPGNTIVDRIEVCAQKRALQLYSLSPNVWSANVQAYSGAIANAEIYTALLRPHDCILSLDLTAGGHLSHGSRVSVTGTIYRVVHYGVDARYRIDYQALERCAQRYKPKLIISGASAYPYKIDFKKIGIIAKRVGAYHLADISHYAGLIAAQQYPSPFAYADIVMSTTHKSLYGPRGAIIWSRNEYAKKIDTAVFPGMQGGPHINTIAAIAAGLTIAKKSKSYYKQVIKNARVCAHTLRTYGASVVGGGTESHMMLLDVRPFGIDGGTAERMLESVGILANRNVLYKDCSVQAPSAVRIGWYAMTQRGMKEKDAMHIAQLIYATLARTQSYTAIRKTIRTYIQNFPIHN